MTTGRSILTFFIVLLAGISLVMTSCKTRQKAETYQPVVRPGTEKEPEKVVQAEEKKAPEPVEIVKATIALVLPFHLKDNFEESNFDSTDPEIKNSSLQALNFYEGAMMAVDSLKRENREINIVAYDAPDDSASAARFFSGYFLREADLVIATLPNHLCPVAAAVSGKHGVNLVLTQASSPSLLSQNKNVALAYTSSITQCHEMVNAIQERYPVSKMILIYRNARREGELASAFRDELMQHGAGNELVEINATDKGFADLPKFLSKTKRNLVFLVSSDEAFISPVLALLEEQGIYGIVVCGLPTWQNFESINFMSFQNIQVVIFDNNFINYYDPNTASLRKQFIQRYSCDPLTSGFSGFELVYKFGKGAGKGRHDLGRLIRKSFENNSGNFNFVDYDSGGLENRRITVLRFNDFRLEPLSDKKE